MKKSSHFFSKTQIIPIFYMRLGEWDLFSTLNIGKKAASFWWIDCESLTDKLSGSKHKQNIC